MVEKNSKTIKHWIESAEYDLESARVMLNGGRFLYVGFLCHLAVEKMLKACYVKIKGLTPPYIHKLRELAREAEIFGMLSDDQKTLLEQLDPLNIQARYPQYKDKLSKDFTLKKCQFIISRTEEFIEWLRQNSLKS
ncbi:MAG: HEPN domain-containing protein [Candidatus Eremiobacteraeota bacterium]|nr:HEPN domain-containing protein [Candidatus Eremiobacteraeota bacterium]